MISKILSAVIIILLPNLGLAAETIAKVTYRDSNYSVISEGRPWEKSCKLTFQTKNGQLKRELSIKREEHGCLMLGPVQLYVSASTDDLTTIIYLESDRGDDSGSTGPIIEAFESTRDSLKKIGEYELFDALFHRQEQQIASVTGNALFSLCDYCEYRVSLNEEENFFVPVTMKVTKQGLLVKASLNSDERKQLLKRFDAVVKKMSEKSDSLVSFSQFANKKRKKLEALLNRK